jgi:hypothetical protein
LIVCKLLIYKELERKRDFPKKNIFKKITGVIKMTKQEIKNMPATKTWKIKELLKLGLTKKEVAYEVGTNYGFVQNVFAKEYPDQIRTVKVKPSIKGFAEKLVELQTVTWLTDLDGLMKRMAKQSEKLNQVELRTDSFENFLEDLFNKKKVEEPEVSGTDVDDEETIENEEENGTDIDEEEFLEEDEEDGTDVDTEETEN